MGIHAPSPKKIQFYISIRERVVNKRKQIVFSPLRPSNRSQFDCLRLICVNCLNANHKSGIKRFTCEDGLVARVFFASLGFMTHVRESVDREAEIEVIGVVHTRRNVSKTQQKLKKSRNGNSYQMMCIHFILLFSSFSLRLDFT